MNDFEAIAQLAVSLLPAIEQGLSVFIHNQNSQKKYAAIVGEINAVATVAAAVAQSYAQAKTATATASS